MFKFDWKRLGIATGLSLTLVAAGCGSDEESTEETSDGSGSDGEKTEETANLGEAVDYKITGIEAGAGVVAASESAVEKYDSLAGWEVVPSSSGAMTTALGEAIENEEPIVVTGWKPHWMFQKYDLKYLKDPKGVFGEGEQIKTMARKGLEEEKPNAYKILDQFQWESADIESVMLEISNGTDVEDAAANWVEANPDKVSAWTEGTEKVDGTEVELAYVEWDTEVASTNVLAHVMEQQGFKVTVTPLDNGVMWQAVANGEADGMVAAWLPLTHESQMAEYGDKVVDLGVNLEGATTGLTVPSYVEAESIEDLKPAE